ncbi:Lytic transglycosylase catalytic [Beijerinckiaceae bacterium RH AL1]|nr:transglycosylase SLT domain-containing protein [Beijerinckiaceae bacterium]VVB47434.1 Lytic transglycosylase catalytic [Beijerinckiaceae bacterium RH CH11]VVB47516.1 Lytic transglycosylase catalytic [Beijerinckiaceae bacterium RH AL8]VVC55887.1 Lytic transglycosylase catalytic [Beijerinckiaceae bacterium RH AL1]
MFETVTFRLAGVLLVALLTSPASANPSAVASRGIVPSVAAPTRADARATPYRKLVLDEAAKAGLPDALVDAVMSIESGYDPSALGGVGEIGLMQVRPETAAMLGFKGLPGQLAEPATNIHYGATYLGQAWHLTKGDVCRTLMKYRAGTGEEMMSALSVSYCARARAHLVAVGSPLAAQITPADLVAAKLDPAETGRATAVVPGRGKARSGKAFWAAMQAKVSRISARIEARWKRLAAR